MTTVFCIGIAVQDHVYRIERLPLGAGKSRASDFTVVGGGLAANAAVAMVRLGATVRFATRLGDDAIGTAILDELAGEGIDVGPSVRVPGKRSPISAVLVDETGERGLVNFADRDLPDMIDALPARLAPDIDAVLGDSRWAEGTIHMLGLARAAGKPAVLDVDRAEGPLDRLVAAATHAAYAAKAAREHAGAATTEDAVRALATRFPGNTILATDGPAGVWWVEGDTLRHQAALPVEAVDTNGAGDVWHGAFAVALAEGQSTREAVCFASVAAALKCTRFGGRRGAPARAEVEARTKDLP
jgi:sulfofructose kinase